MAFGFKRQQPAPAPAPSTLDQCAADYANAKTDRDTAGSDANARANGNEAAATRTTEGGWTR